MFGSYFASVGISHHQWACAIFFLFGRFCSKFIQPLLCNSALIFVWDMAATVWTFHAEYYLWCFDWLLVLGWLAAGNPRTVYSVQRFTPCEDQIGCMPCQFKSVNLSKRLYFYCIENESLMTWRMCLLSRGTCCIFGGEKSGWIDEDAVSKLK